VNSLKSRGEIPLLALLIFVLPILEAPKNLLWFVYLGVWVFNRWRAKDFGGRWDGWDTLLALWISSGYVVAAFAGLHRDEWSGAHDIVRYGLLLWAIKRSGYSAYDLYKLLWWSVVSAGVALTYGLWELHVTHTKQALELHSVGHVNHSAVYLATSFGIALACTLASWLDLNRRLRSMAVFATLYLAGGVIHSGSRGAVGAMLLLALSLAFFWGRRSYKPLAITLVLMVLTSIAVVTMKMEVLEKQERGIATSNLSSYRAQIWNLGLAAWQRFPLFGVGMNNFNQITKERVKSWVESAGRPYDADRYYLAPHAHSLFVNTLAERGIYGLGILLTVMGCWGWDLLRKRPRKEDDAITWAIWGASWSGLFVTLTAGVVNTPLHQENALLTAMLLGFWLALRAGLKGTPPVPGEAILR
jgi:O-antigen ligase